MYKNLWNYVKFCPQASSDRAFPRATESPYYNIKRDFAVCFVEGGEGEVPRAHADYDRALPPPLF